MTPKSEDTHVTMTRATAEDTIAAPDVRANRPVTMAHRLEYAALRILFFFFRLIGIERSSAIAGGFCRFVGPKLSKISDRGRTGMALAFPDWSEAKIEATLKDVWENLGRTSAEFAHLKAFTPYQSSKYFEIEKDDHVISQVKENRPAIFVSGHFANWELMAIAMKDFGLEYGLVYRAANNPLVDAYIVKERVKVMTARQYPKGRAGWRSVVKTIKAGRSLGMLVDQKLNDGIETPFLGVSAMTAPAPARLALKYNAMIIPAQIMRTHGAHFKLLVKDPIDFKATGDMDRDVKALTILINASLEEDIQKNPGQWLWLHRRWPKGLYKK